MRGGPGFAPAGRPRRPSPHEYRSGLDRTSFEYSAETIGQAFQSQGLASTWPEEHLSICTHVILFVCLCLSSMHDSTCPCTSNPCPIVTPLPLSSSASLPGWMAKSSNEPWPIFPPGRRLRSMPFVGFSKAMPSSLPPTLSAFSAPLLTAMSPPFSALCADSAWSPFSPVLLARSVTWSWP
jgi:hypothetical protein